MNEFKNLLTTLRLRMFAGLFGFALLAAATSFWATPANAIIVCHDYALYRATGKDPRPLTSTENNGTGIIEMRRRLKDELGYERFPITNAAETPDYAAGYLKPGDVIILRDDHSGYVNSIGTIDHFIQVYGKSGTKYASSELPLHSSTESEPPLREQVGGLYLGDTLGRFLKRPFYKGPIGSLEVWRKVPASKGPQPCDAAERATWAKMTGTWDASYGPVTFSGSCENVAGHWLQGEWGERGTSLRGVIKGGRVSGTSLTFNYSQSWNNKTGSDSCHLSADGRKLECSYMQTLQR